LENVNAFYPNAKVDIYSKWGTLVYHSEGYTNPWDGSKNNQELPAATYYYVIDLKKPNFKPVAGSVTIIR
jgi:gliding motility-associated-like protein